MALIISVEPTTMASIVGVARRLTLHVCIACLDRDEIAWAGRATARQVRCIRDSFSEDGLAEAFHGNRRLRLLA